MRSIPERAAAVSAAYMTSLVTAHIAGADHATAKAIASQQIAIALQEFQDDLLESQRQTAIALQEMVK